MGTKMAVAFANIFMAKVETEIISQSTLKPLVWKRFIDDIFTLWDTTGEGILQFIEQANKHHLTTKITAEISERETNFLVTIVYKGERFKEESVLDLRTHFNETLTSLHATNMELKESSSKERFLDFSELTLLRHYLKRI